jgi:GNAT superfamily N-acetyltransferase
MNNINYIPATDKHIDVLVKSRIEFMTDFWGKQTDEAVQKLRVALTAFFEREIPSENYISWLAYHNEILVAVGGMMIQQRPGSFRFPEGKSGYIMNMYTIPAYRRQGIAAIILEKLIESGKNAGVSFFDLHASKLGEPVYIKAGFQILDQPSYRKIL